MKKRETYYDEAGRPIPDLGFWGWINLALWFSVIIAVAWFTTPSCVG